MLPKSNKIVALSPSTSFPWIIYYLLPLTFHSFVFPLNSVSTLFSLHGKGGGGMFWIAVKKTSFHPFNLDARSVKRGLCWRKYEFSKTNMNFNGNDQTDEMVVFFNGRLSDPFRFHRCCSPFFVAWSFGCYWLDASNVPKCRTCFTISSRNPNETLWAVKFNHFFFCATIISCVQT